jgi:hypothetical protein
MYEVSISDHRVESVSKVHGVYRLWMWSEQGLCFIYTGSTWGRGKGLEERLDEHRKNLLNGKSPDGHCQEVYDAHPGRVWGAAVLDEMPDATQAEILQREEDRLQAMLNVDSIITLGNGTIVLNP